MKSQRAMISILLLQVMAWVGCFRHETPVDGNVLTDRLINLVVIGQLFTGESAPEHADMVKLSGWFKRALQKNARVVFRFDGRLPGITTSPGGDACKVSHETFSALKNLNHFFQVNAAVQKSRLDVQRIRRAILSPKGVEDIRALIRASGDNPYSETGGVTTIDPKIDRLYFLPIPSDNEPVARMLQSAMDDVVSASAAVKRIPSDLDYVPVRTRRIKTILDSDKPAAEKLRFFRQYAELYLTYSRYSYVLKQSTQYSAIARAGISGYYLGVFHVHPPENTPSIEDKIGSLLRKNLVIVPMKNGFDVHYLDFSKDPGAPPVVISYRE